MGNLTKYFPFLGIFAVIIPFWQQTRDLLIKIFRVFWKQRDIPFDFTSAFYKELSKKSILLDLDNHDIYKGHSYCFSKEYKSWIPVLFKLTSFEIFLYKKFIPIFISRKENGVLRVQYLKFSFNFEKFFDNIAKLVYKETSEASHLLQKASRFYIEEKKGISLKQIKSSMGNQSNNQTNATNTASFDKTNNKYYILEPWQIVGERISKSIGININDVEYSITISDKNKYQFTNIGNYVLSQVKKWLEAKGWYEERNINWRRGILLNGKPGNGKSSMVLEVAKKVGIPLYIFDLSSMDNEEFDNSLNNLCGGSAIILFEDFDNVFHGRVNINKTNQFGGLTFDYFINKLSGVNSIKNKFIFITTNNVDKIDTAILRPGRIDEKIEILPLNKDEKLNMAKVILGNDNLIEKAMANSELLSTAEFENKCVQTALESLWNK